MLYLKTMKFDDGSYIESADHVSLFYIKGDNYVAIEPVHSWFQIPFIPAKQNIKLNDLKQWGRHMNQFGEYDDSDIKYISDQDKEDIMNKLKIYFGEEFGKFI